jgi:hypothetical protein
MFKRIVTVVGLAIFALAGSEPPRTINNNALVSSDLPKFRIEPDPRLKFVGRAPFNIRNIAEGERFVWAEADKNMHVRSLLIVQFEGLMPGIAETYHYPTKNPTRLGANEYSHNIWAWDSAADHASRQHPDADASDDLLADKGYKVDGELIMSRFARIVGDDKKHEVIIFYDESVKDLGHKLSDFADEGPKADWQVKLEKELDQRSLNMFRVVD